MFLKSLVLDRFLNFRAFGCSGLEALTELVASVHVSSQMDVSSLAAVGVGLPGAGCWDIKNAGCKNWLEYSRKFWRRAGERQEWLQAQPLPRIKMRVRAAVCA